MTTRRLAKSGRAAIFGHFMAILAIFLEIDAIICLPISPMKIDGQTDF